MNDDNLEKLHTIVAKYLNSYQEDLDKSKSLQDYYLLLTSILVFKNLLLIELKKQIELDGEDNPDDIFEIIESQAKTLAGDINQNFVKQRMN